jgi:hypothetical protein
MQTINLQPEDGTASGRYGRSPAWRRLGIGTAGWSLLMLCLCGGIGRFRPAPATRPGDPNRAWIEARSLCIFPLAGSTLPQSTDGLAQSLVDGLKGRMRLAAGREPVTIDGSAFPAINALRVDLSDASADLSKASLKVKRERPAKPGIIVHQLEVQAQPLLVAGGKFSYRMSFADANLELREDKQGHPILALKETADGTFLADTTRSDLEKVLGAALNASSKKIGVTIDRVDLKLSAQSDRSVAANVRIAASEGILTTAVRFDGKIVIDDQMNATLEDLKCEGEGPIGLILMGIVGPFVHSYEGKERPLVAFPSPLDHLKDIHVQLNGDAVHLTAAFGK